MVELYVASSDIRLCCFSHDGRLVAVATGGTAYIWDITGSDPHLVETFIGHTNTITSLVFFSSSSLISVSIDQSVKLWQIDVSPTDPVEADPKSTPLTSTPIKSITLQAKDGIAISTGHCLWKTDMWMLVGRIIRLRLREGKHIPDDGEVIDKMHL